MKKLVILLLAVMLAACSAQAVPTTEPPAAAPPEPTSTPVVVIQTVLVEPTQVPTEAPAPTPVVVTVVVEPTQAPVEQAPTQAPAQAPAQPVSNENNANAPIALDNALGKGVFVNMTMSGDTFTLRCFPRDITFNVTANNPAIVDALLYYRIVDKPNGLYPSEWKNGGKMTYNGNGNFSMVFSGENVDPNIRLDGGWFDFQFVGLAKSGDVVDRSQKIERLVTYTFDCAK